jgi:hypothetical protein
MTANSALGLVLIGVAGALREREDAGIVWKMLSVLAALLVFALGVLTLVEYLFGAELRIDRLIAGVRSGHPSARPALPSALGLTLLAAAVFCFDLRPRRAGHARPSG